jgi:beta-galactosidase
VGYKGGVEVNDERRTAGAPARVVLTADRASLRADGRDATRIIATVVDTNGVPVPSATNWLEFQVNGAVRLLGPARLDVVWGLAAINVMSGSGAGPARVRVTSRGLTAGECTLTVEK